MPRTRGQQYPRTRTDLVAAPIVGMDDTFDWNVQRPGYAYALTNVYVPPGRAGQEVIGRPGLEVLGAQLGGVGVRTIQYLGQFIKSDDTRVTICICGGQFYTLDWGTSTWTEVLDAGDFSGASITLSTTARFHSVTLNDKIVFWDGTNQPWMWDGTTGSGLTELTNAEIFTGPGASYYSKLFGLKASGFYWSEEGDPTTGYQAGGYNNAWEPLSAGKFTSIAASNAALYVAERNRIIRITGAVNDDFQTAGTRSDVSERVGTVTPMLVTDNGVVLLSSDGEPYVINSGMQDMWRDCRTATSTMNLSALEQAVIVEWPMLDVVLIGVPMLPNSVISQWLVFRLTDGDRRYIGRWDLGLNDAAAVVLDDSDEHRLLVSGNADGYVYLVGTPSAGPWDDGFAGGTQSIPHTVTWQPLGADADTERTYDRMTTILSGDATASRVTLSYQTSRGYSTPRNVDINPGSGDTLDLTFTLDTSTLAIDQPERRVVMGLAGYGRWISPTVAHAEMSKTFGLKTITIDAYPWGTDPSHP